MISIRERYSVDKKKSHTRQNIQGVKSDTSRIFFRVVATVLCSLYVDLEINLPSDLNVKPFIVALRRHPKEKKFPITCRMNVESFRDLQFMQLSDFKLKISFLIVLASCFVVGRGTKVNNIHEY